MSAEKIAAAVYDSRNGVGATPFRRQREEYRREYIKDAESVLRLLKLSPSAASALMDGTATVVPVEPTDEQCEAIAAQMDVEWRKQTLHENYPSIRAQHRATIAVSPYRSTPHDH